MPRCARRRRSWPPSPTWCTWASAGIGVALADALGPLLGDVPAGGELPGHRRAGAALLDPTRGRGAAPSCFERGPGPRRGRRRSARPWWRSAPTPSGCAIIRPAVDLDRWPVRPPAGPGGPLPARAVGRLSPAKGLDDLLAAVAVAAATAGIDARLTVVGDGPHRDALPSAGGPHRSGRPRWTWSAAATPDEVAAELAGAHLFVSPSLSEGINNGVLEAMATRGAGGVHRGGRHGRGHHRRGRRLAGAVRGVPTCWPRAIGAGARRPRPGRRGRADGRRRSRREFGLARQRRSGSPSTVSCPAAEPKSTRSPSHDRDRTAERDPVPPVERRRGAQELVAIYRPLFAGEARAIVLQVVVGVRRPASPRRSCSCSWPGSHWRSAAMPRTSAASARSTRWT